MLRVLWNKVSEHNLIERSSQSEPCFVALDSNPKKTLLGSQKLAIDQYIQGLKFQYKGNWLGALDCFLKSAKKDYPPSFLALYLIYSTGSRGYEIDDEESQIWKEKVLQNLKWFSSRAQKKNPNAISLHNLADIYYEGIQPQNFPKAAKYYKMASDLNFPPSQSQLGRCYQYGSGVPKNPETAFQYYRTSADQGYPPALYNLAWCYHYGSGVIQNIPFAIKYYSISANKGFGAAQYSLGFLYQTGKGVKTDFSKSIYYFSLAAEQGNPHAWNGLGICYECGLGVPKDERKATEYYKGAVERGLEDAKEALVRLK